MTNKMVETALKYKHKYGFCVIPAKGKVPTVKWQDFQEEMPTDDQITEWWSEKPDANIAVITGRVSGYICVVDVDSYKDATVIQTVESLLPVGFRYPISTTPRGGQHWWFRSKTQLGDKIGFLKGCDFRSQGIIIIPPSKGYKWQNSPKKTEIPMLPKAVIEEMSSVSFDYGSNKAQDNGEYFSEGVRDKNLFTIANTLIRSGHDPEFIRESLRRIISTWGERDEVWINTKIKSAMKRQGHDNLSEDIREWVLSSSGVFVSSDVVRDLDLSSRVVRKNSSKILGRLVDEGLIERVGKKNGQFRRVETSIELMDWKSAETENYYGLKMPLGLHNDINIFPSNIIIIAGTPNMGKTSFVLNIAKMNTDKDVRYFNSEMGPEELKTRLLMFDDMEVEEWTTKFYNRNGNFGDVVEPDALNIIDFLEITENFFLIADEIRKIHDRLKKGIAVICLQKKKDVELGRGAEFGLEKPRLYMSMDFQSLKIIKCKNPKGQENVNGKEIKFKLLHGTTFIQDNAIQS